MVEQKQDTTDAYAIKLDAPAFLENNKDEVELPHPLLVTTWWGNPTCLA